jgi:hypothetical protein
MKNMNNMNDMNFQNNLILDHAVHDFVLSPLGVEVVLAAHKAHGALGVEAVEFEVLPLTAALRPLPLC